MEFLVYLQQLIGRPGSKALLFRQPVVIISLISGHPKKRCGLWDKDLPERPRLYLDSEGYNRKGGVLFLAREEGRLRWPIPAGVESPPPLDTQTSLKGCGARAPALAQKRDRTALKR